MWALGGHERKNRGVKKRERERETSFEMRNALTSYGMHDKSAKL
jgi:hypothetical protein